MIKKQLTILEKLRENKIDHLLQKFANNVYSQNGEDGILEEILKRLGIENGLCCEFGAWDGKYLSNTFNLVENKGWKAIYIESDEKKYEDLIKTKLEFMNQITILNKMIQLKGESSLNEIFSSLKILNIDLLSIDIDSYDYQIMESLKLSQIKPKIIVIEINSAIPMEISLIHGDYTNLYGGMGAKGSSFIATLKLGLEMGYALVCHTGNLIFVRNDLVKNNFYDIKINSTDLWWPGEY